MLTASNEPADSRRLQRSAVSLHGAGRQAKAVRSAPPPALRTNATQQPPSAGWNDLFCLHLSVNKFPTLPLPEGLRLHARARSCFRSAYRRALKRTTTHRARRGSASWISVSDHGSLLAETGERFAYCLVTSPRERYGTARAEWSRKELRRNSQPRHRVGHSYGGQERECYE